MQTPLAQNASSCSSRNMSSEKKAEGEVLQREKAALLELFSDADKTCESNLKCFDLSIQTVSLSDRSIQSAGPFCKCTETTSGSRILEWERQYLCYRVGSPLLIWQSCNQHGAGTEEWEGKPWKLGLPSLCFWAVWDLKLAITVWEVTPAMWKFLGPLLWMHGY